MELTSKEKLLPIVINGVEYQLKKPKLGHQLLLEEYSTGIKAFRTSITYLVDLGLPEEVAKGLDDDDFLEIVKYVSSPSKKN